MPRPQRREASVETGCLCPAERIGEVQGASVQYKIRIRCAGVIPPLPSRYWPFSLPAPVSNVESCGEGSGPAGGGAGKQRRTTVAVASAPTAQADDGVPCPHAGWADTGVRHIAANLDGPRT